ncbi:ABC transporter permease subunit [Bergeyella sp. RCAD1439]|uniref:ABC transporter permease subunit n=1 Tax=Bergeyella anatis TaxID=3113737 RepID=UPI002E18BB17|nr:ABC transporter permease subunit [Bergeyella sp. RCAD1439]
MYKIAKFILKDILKSKITGFYAVILFVLSWAALGMEGHPAKANLNLLNIVLFVVPLFSLVFSVIYVYNSSQFIELLSTQPIKRDVIWTGIFLGLSLSQVLVFLAGCGIPIFIYSSIDYGLCVLLGGALLCLDFVALAMYAAVSTNDKAKGIGIAIFVWVFFNIFYDGLLLILMFQFSDYPIERIMVVLSSLSPIGLTRVFAQLQLDLSGMLGYSGAIFKSIFGTGSGIFISGLILLLWAGLPFLGSLLKFRRKDL